MCKKNLKKVFIKFRFYTVKVMILFRYRYYPVTVPLQSQRYRPLLTVTDRFPPLPNVTGVTERYMRYRTLHALPNVTCVTERYMRYKRYRTFQSVSSVTERYIFYLTKNFK